MKYEITRRDFMNGIVIGTGASLLAPAELFAQIPPGEPPLTIRQHLRDYVETMMARSRSRTPSPWVG